jgi:release factor glutamine methyltransferase
MHAGDLRFEPMHALTPGTDGLAAIRRVLAGAAGWLVPRGIVAVEHGYDQAAAVHDLFRAAGFANVRSARDIAGTPRVAYGSLAAFVPFAGRRGAGRLPAST